MITEYREISRCEYCGKIYLSKRFADRHEIRCLKNPDNNRACYGCKHLTKKDTTISTWYYGECGEKNLTLLHCAVHDRYVYPSRVEHNGTAWETEDLPNEPMPRECSHFVNQFD